jgi:hypothetical protein
MFKPNMMKWALAYAEKYDMAIIPLHNVIDVSFLSKDGKRCTCSRGAKCASAGKHPRMGAWQNNWSKNHEQIEEWWTKWPDANIGMVTGKASGGICVVDVDTVGGGLSLAEHIKDIVVPTSRTARMDAEGRHYFFKTEEEFGDKIGGIKGVDFRNFGVIVLPPSQGVAKRYEWEGSIKDVEIPELPESLVVAFRGETVKDKSKEKESSAVSAEPVSPKAFIKGIYNILSKSFKFKDGLSEFRGRELYYSIESNTSSFIDELEFVQGSRESALFSVANALVKAGKSRKFVMEALTRLMFTCHDVDADFILKKIDNAIKRQGEPSVPSVPGCNQAQQGVTAVTPVTNMPLTDRVREYAGYTTGAFRNQDCYNDLSLRTIAEKTTVRKTLGGMADDGILERVHGKQGMYRKIQAAIVTMNWEDVEISDYYPLKMPLDLHSAMAFYPKNIMVVAGAKSSGKTAFLMNMAWMNKGNHPGRKLRYLNSEMGAEELKKRISMFEYPFKDWSKDIDFIERSAEFHDVIDPNGFNIIDFLEIGDAFYKIQQDIKQIHDKLEKGVCIIGLQKATGKHILTGRGGDFSKEKSRIYLSLDRDADVRDQYQLTVVDCKNPVHGTQTGRIIPYTLNSGTFFIDGEITNFKKGE